MCIPFIIIAILAIAIALVVVVIGLVLIVLVVTIVTAVDIAIIGIVATALLRVRHAEVNYEKLLLTCQMVLDVVVFLLRKLTSKQ